MEQNIIKDSDSILYQFAVFATHPVVKKKIYHMDYYRNNKKRLIKYQKKYYKKNKKIK